MAADRDRFAYARNDSLVPLGERNFRPLQPVLSPTQTKACQATAMRLSLAALLDTPGFPSGLERGRIVKPDIHPQPHLVTAVCACGNTFQVHSTQDELRLEICNECHPYFTGKQKLIDTAGRVERFKKRYEATQQKQAAQKQA